ncbi:MAG: hypothetical protein V4722_21850 [Bacteroidota bacterium]
MKKLLGFILIFCGLLFMGCKKKDQLTFVYEIKTSVPVVAPYTRVITKTGLGTQETSEPFSAGTVWTKTEVTDTEYRPIVLIMNAQNIYLTSAGTVTVSISVNGAVQSSASFPATAIGGQFSANTSAVTYTVQ